MQSRDELLGPGSYTQKEEALAQDAETHPAEALDIQILSTGLSGRHLHPEYLVAMLSPSRAA